MIDYTKAIVEAAKEYVAAKDRRTGSDNPSQLSENIDLAYSKLVWMIQAEKYGWNPEMYSE